jgi:UDPglucose--hexose-1-phosphate uridylyltransferase
MMEHPHRRYNPLTREWVLVSPQRLQRPWQGQVEKLPAAQPPSYDKRCYLCPGNTRAGRAKNPAYPSTFVFDNDFPALRPDTLPDGADDSKEGGLLVAHAEPGICRVVCFSPQHNTSLSKMGSTEIRRVVDVWVEQYQELGALDFVNHVQIFENRGEMMGCSNPHPHGQIWAQQTIPNQVVQEELSQAVYLTTNHRCLLCDYAALEIKHQERLVLRTDSFLAVVPYWAVWPFETLVLPQRHLTGMDQMERAERHDLADLLRQLTAAYDRLFDVSFPYTMGFHQRPTDGGKHEEWHLHAHFFPPLLRSATVRKFMVGYEMLGNPQRDITAEVAAERLRAVME